MDMQRVGSAIDRYSKDDPQRASLLSFFSSIWTAQDEIAQRIPASEHSVDKDASADALATHQPLFMLSRPSVPLDTFVEAVQTISRIVSEDAGLDDAASAALAEADFAAVLNDDLLGKALDDVDAFTASVAQTLGADAEGPLTFVTVDFVLSAALTPFLERPAAEVLDSLGEIDWHVWNSGECPVCGTPASVSRVVDGGQLQGGRRILTCPLCRAEWDYQRIRCVRCGDRSHNNLHYLYDERDPGHRIHVCESCHGYIKVSVERDLDINVIPQVEDVVTLPLDDLASSKGYSTLGDEVPE